MEKEKVINFLKRQISEIDSLFSMDADDPTFKSWKAKTERLLERFFGKDSSHLKDFKNVRYGLMIVSVNTPKSHFDDAYREGLVEMRAILNSIIEEVEEWGMVENGEENNKANQSEFTFNLNQTLNVNINNVLENNLNVTQYKELEEILKIKSKKEKESKLKDFLVALGSGGTLEILKAILMSGFGG